MGWCEEQKGQLKQITAIRREAVVAEWRHHNVPLVCQHTVWPN